MMKIKIKAGHMLSCNLFYFSTLLYMITLVRALPYSRVVLHDTSREPRQKYISLFSVYIMINEKEFALYL